MAKYKLVKDYDLDEVVSIKDTEIGHSIPLAPGNRHYQEYLEWVSEGNTPDPADPAPTPPTLEEIYDQTLQNQQVLKAVVLALNDGTVVPGANVSNAVLKTAIKSKM